MSYNTRLQNNNTSLEGNNTDLQTILNTINNLPTAGSGETINLDAEITTQDALIAELSTILEGKTAGNVGNIGTAIVTVELTGNDGVICFYYNNGQFYAKAIQGDLVFDVQEDIVVDINSCFLVAMPYGSPAGFTNLLENGAIYYSYKIITEDTVVS